MKNLKQFGIAVGYFLMTLAPVQNASAQYFYNDGSNCCCDDDWCSASRFSFYADYLYWNISEENLDYARQNQINMTEQVAVPTSTLAEADFETIHGIDFRWRSGFRIGAGYQLPCDNWDIDVNWIHFNVKNNGHARGSVTSNGPLPGTNFVSNMLFVDEFFGPASINNNTPQPFFISNPSNTTDGDLSQLGSNGAWETADARWRLHFDVVDATIGKSFAVTDCVKVQPFIGARYLSIKQSYLLGYTTGPNAPDLPALTPLTLTQAGFNKMHTKYHAGGLIGGIAGDWSFGCGLSLYSSAGVGLVYGKAHARSLRGVAGTETFAGTTTNVAFVDKIHRQRELLTAAIDLAVGFDWHPDYFECFDLGLAVGYEFHQYFDQNLFRLFKGHNTKGNLGLHGLVVRAEASF